MNAELQYPTVPLWSTNVPEAKGTENLDDPTLTIHQPSGDRNTGCGVIVCPGGGYRILASDHEGLQVAQALNKVGITAFVLKYRVAPRYPSTVSLLDGQRAVRLVRSKAKEYGLHSLGMLGFSAGGHLTLAVGTAKQALNKGASDPIDRCSSEVDFMVPVYAVSNGRIRGRKADEYFATETEVDKSTPPTFLVHTHEDEIVSAEQSVIFYNALLEHGVPAELHIFQYGEHGVGLAESEPVTGIWFTLMQRWLARSGFLTKAKRLAVTGHFPMDEYPALVWLTFLPINTNYPASRVRLTRESHGKFALPESQGLVPGIYRVEIQPGTNKWPPDATGEYTLTTVTSKTRSAMVNEDGSIKFES